MASGSENWSSAPSDTTIAHAEAAHTSTSHASEDEDAILPVDIPHRDETPEQDPNVEATELRSVPPSVRRRIYYTSDGRAASEVTTATDDEQSLRLSHDSRRDEKWHNHIARWWRRHVSVTVEASARRDHLALERTFLAYLRTSLAFAMLGVLCAQLFRIQRSVSPDPEFGYFVVGKPLAATCNAIALVTVVVGAWRFWRQQTAMTRGKVWAGGVEVVTIMGLSILFGVALFVLALALNIRREATSKNDWDPA